ncbi:MAG: DAK2 domain-containing protein [Bacilli bacterium]|nr:DAK2 domain-containing protein [Bacilli bacterium]
MKVIDGQMLKRMFISGANNLYNHYPEIDALNVFPVPDGDTGMNMNLTLTSGSKEIQNRSDNNIYDIAKTFSRGLLMGARGNSGVITSQIFRGFSQGLENKEEASVVDFSNALQKGVEVAYRAVVKPVEGTILTVVRESSQYLADHIKEASSFEKALNILINEARESLKRTPDLLPILKEVGVIDSGGAGLIKIYEGMQAALDDADVERNQATSTTNENPLVAAGASMDEEEFGYCTEFIMSLGPDSVKKPFNEKRFTMVVGSHGNSLVVVHDEDIVKVHVHTMNPGNILNYAQQFGEFLKIKIENMTEQHHALETGAQSSIEHTDLVSEEEKTEDLGPKEENALIAVSAGNGIDELFNEIGIKVIVKGGQTMNPSSEDFVAAIKKANAKNIFIFPNNSNIVMAASQACEMIDDEEISAFVIPSKTIPQGITASINFDPEGSAEDNFRNMKSALKNVKSGEITFSIRDSEINGVHVKKDDFIGIFEKDIVVDSPNKIEATKELIRNMVDDDTCLLTILVGEDVTKEEEKEIKDFINDEFPDIDIDMRNGGQPVYSFLIGAE